MSASNMTKLTEAIRNKTPVSFYYQNTLRKVCPHLLGVTADERLVLHGYQYGGESSKGQVTPESGGWRFFYLDLFEMTTLDPGGAWYPEQLKKAEGPYQPPKFIAQVLEVVS